VTDRLTDSIDCDSRGRPRLTWLKTTCQIPCKRRTDGRTDGRTLRPSVRPPRRWSLTLKESDITQFNIGLNSARRYLLRIDFVGRSLLGQLRSTAHDDGDHNSVSPWTQLPPMVTDRRGFGNCYDFENEKKYFYFKFLYQTPIIRTV